MARERGRKRQFGITRVYDIKENNSIGGNNVNVNEMMMILMAKVKYVYNKYN